MPDIKFIAGLGNPGEKYANTRHNFGFMAVDEFINLKRLAWKNWNDTASVCFYSESGRKTLFAKPQTFMNNSGFPVKSLLHYYKIKPEEMLVIYDDFSIPSGEFRFRGNGSAGGHNGVASIIEQIGTDVFPRMKLGIGPLPQNSKTADFVLSNFNEEAKQKAQSVLKLIEEILDMIIDSGFDKAVSKISSGKKI